MISRDWKVVFVHQRKSAGTSVKDLFPPVEGPDRGRFNNGLLDPTWDDPEFAGYYRFTVVRNPWDRFVSAWNYCRSTRGRPILDVIENLPMPDIRDNVLAPARACAPGCATPWSSPSWRATARPRRWAAATTTATSPASSGERGPP